MHTSIYLASQSPRRAELLRQIGVSFQCVEQNTPELHQKHETSQEFVLRLAKDKALDGLKNIQIQKLPAAPVLASDTIVVVDDMILGKPENQQHALKMLTALSNRVHRVMTAVAMVDANLILKTVISTSEVEFAAISPKQALAYWQTGEPQDKAGSYAIQGLGAIFVKSLNGSYSGVMGLPIFETTQLLKEFSIDILSEKLSNE